MNTHTRNQKGFTLVELLIVVIILGILAAVVIPQFNSAATESKEAALASNLATIRQAVEMYKVQHNDAFPTSDIVNQLTGETNILGVVAGGSAYGPYLRNSFPQNPLSTAATALLRANVVTAATAPTKPADDSGAWVYDTVTGEFRANLAGATVAGTDYFAL